MISILKRISSTNRSTLAVFFGIAISRIFGYLRLVIIANYFGAGSAYDAFVAAFRIPNFFRNLLGEGSLSASFIPVLSEYLGKGDEEGAKRISQILFSLMIIFLGLLTFVGIVLAPYLSYLIAGGFDSGKRELTVNLIRILFPVSAFFILAAWAMGILHSHKRFLIPSLAPISFSVLQIVFVILLFSYFTDDPIEALAYGSVIGGLLQFLVQMPAVYRIGTRIKLNFAFDHPSIKKIIRLSLPVWFGYGVMNINSLIDTFLASYLADGSISALDYAARLYILPLSLFGIAISTVALPSLSQDAARDRLETFKTRIRHSWLQILYLTIPSSLGLIFFGKPIVRILFERGEFTAGDTNLVTAVLLFYSLGIVAYSSRKLLVSAFHSLQDTKTPVRLATIAVLMNIILSIILMLLMQASGIALATSISATFNMFLLVVYLHRRVGNLFGFGSLISIGKMLFAGAIMVLVGILIQIYFLDSVRIDDFRDKLFEVGCLLVPMMITYLALSYLLLQKSFLRLMVAEDITERGIVEKVVPID